MKKKMICLSLGLCLTLSGCTGVNGAVEQKMLEKAGISADSNYQTYQGYEADGKLTQQGYYSEDVFEAEDSSATMPVGTALVSFAKNSYLLINYYSDEGRTVPIEVQSCYLKPGTSVYASVEISRDVASSMYSFAGFRLYQFKNGGRDLIDTIEPGEDGFVLEITEDMIGSDYSIEPIGDYGSRKISFRDFYTDNNGKTHDLSGTWLVDDRVVSGDEVAINPVASYIISYEYDNDEYFYLSSTPQSYYTNNEDGIVIFELMEATDDSYDYSVELCKYLSVDVVTSIERTVSLNGSSEKIVAAGTKFPFTGLKYGDSLLLITNLEWPQLVKCKDLVVTETRLSNGTYEYQIRVPDKDGQFWFDPSEYTYEHGEIGFKWLGEEITAPIQLAKGRVITYYEKSADRGYWLPEGDHTIIVGNDEETRAALNNICFVPEVKATVHLVQPTHGGTIRYYADGKELKGTTFATTSGTVITMKFEPWPGWISRYTGEELYAVTEKLDQTVQIRTTQSVDSAFFEDDNHKPTLEIVLHKSVGDNMTFTVSADELPEQKYKFDGKWYNNDIIALTAKVGTSEGINFVFGNRSLESGTAVKILVEMEDTKGNKTSYSRLINNLAQKQEPIDIYGPAELGLSEVWYKTIKITLSVVEVECFTAPRNPAHGSITVRSVDTQATLKTGDLVEPSTEVTVTITPSDDYYVTGKNVKNDIYQSKMKFSKYLEDIQGIISDHPIEKYIHLTLVPGDQYGLCTYKLGKDEVSGNIRVKEGQELSITYTVTVSGYAIEGGSSGFLGIGKTDTQKTETITITKALDGKSIDRTSFGINVVKGE